MAKTIQDQLAEKIKAKFPEADVKKVNQDNYVDIHLPGVHPKRGTHLFFNTAGGAIKLGFYCRDEEFTQQVLAKNGNLEAYSQGVRLKGNPEWRKVDAACDAAFAFVESLTGFATQSSSKTPRPSASGNAGSTLLQRIKAAYPKCSINEEKSYASFTFKSAFLYELRIQKDAIRLLAANYPQKASVAKCFDLIARHDLFIHKIQDRYPVIVEPGKVSPDKLTVRIEIPYQGADLENEGFITNLIATCEQFHEAVAPLINGFQAQPVGTLREVMGDGTPNPTASGATPKKEAPVATSSQEDDLSIFDLTEFDVEGRAIGMRDPAAQSQPENSEEDELSLEAILSELESKLEEEGEESSLEVELPMETPAEPAQFDESDRCLDDPIAFLISIQQVRTYYLGLSPKSKAYRDAYQSTLLEYTKAAIVPRIKNKMLRLAHEDGNLIEALVLGPMLKAEESYKKNYDTHDDYVRDLGNVISDLLSSCNVGLYLDTLEFFMYLGDMLDEEESPNGSLTVQDRYFPLFLMLKASPEQDLDNLEMVLDKGAKSRNETSDCDVKSLVLKASGNFNQLSNEEKLALVLYDFILWDEGPGLDIKIADIKAAQNIFKVQTLNAYVGEPLIGGFKDNASYEIFQFFNVEFNREGFHAFCLERWKEFLMEWELGLLKLLVYRVSEDFHPNTYRNNPVLEDYLEIYEGFRKTNAESTPPKEEAPSMFDLTEFDEEGRPIGMRDPSGPSQPENSEEDELSLEAILSQLESQLEEEGEEEEESSSEAEVPKETAAEQAQFDESDHCLADPMPFLTCVQLVRFYYFVLASDSQAYRDSYDEILLEFTKAAIVPRISKQMIRLAHEGDNAKLLMPGPMQKSWELYDEDYPTHNDYIQSLEKIVSDLVQHCNTGLFLDTLELFMYLGDMLEEMDSPTGSLAPQDRYFPLFLMLKASPEQDPENLEIVFNKGSKSRNANNGCDVKALLLKASGNFGQLSNEEKLALVLYDFILWDEKPGLDIKLADIAAAKSIFTLVTQKATLGEKLVGGFNDNASFEIFQFFNVEFNREGFHAFCLERWKELSSEWNELKLQLLLEHVKRDFHPNTYVNNPVLKDYLDIYGGVKVVALKAETSSPKAPDSQKIKTVKIGNQTWMAENLNTEYFSNGDPIPYAESEEEWAEASENSQPAWCYYDNDPENGKKYGRLYNWYAVNDSRGIAPSGWRVASDEDWDELAETLGGEEVGKKIKSKQGWNDDGNGTDEVGFNALPGGLRDIEGEFGYRGEACYFWTSTEYSEENAADRFLNHDEDEIDSYDLGKSSGYYVRCIREEGK